MLGWKECVVSAPKRLDVHLRDVIEEDLPTFFADQRDPDAVRMAAFRSRDWEPFITHWKKILDDNTCITRTVVLDGRVAGNVVCWGDPAERKVGYWIGRQFWGKGVATEALSQFLKLATTRPLYAYVAKHNVASLRVVQKCGFVITGEVEGPSGGKAEPVREVILRLDVPAPAQTLKTETSLGA